MSIESRDERCRSRSIEMSRRRIFRWRPLISSANRRRSAAQGATRRTHAHPTSETRTPSELDSIVLEMILQLYRSLPRLYNLFKQSLTLDGPRSQLTLPSYRRLLVAVSLLLVLRRHFCHLPPACGRTVLMRYPTSGVRCPRASDGDALLAAARPTALSND